MKETPLVTIPHVDLRPQGASLMTAHAERARILIEASKGTLGWVSRALALVALPLGDALAKRWLRVCNNPYLPEIEAAERALGIQGIYALNCSYEWGCTSGVFESAESPAPTLTRVLDWPFPELGRQLVVAHQQGAGGEFFNATWPGVSGVFQAVAPGRFAAALNQAPMRRHPTGIVLDWIQNRIRQQRSRALPPAHLLRQVFETAKDYAQAKRLLSTVPVCLPVIYILGGTEPGQGCVIERLENSAAIREIQPGRDGVSRVAAANHFASHLNGAGWGWLPRNDNSLPRACAADTMRPEAADAALSWYVAPIANPLSRLAMQMEAKSGRFTLMGTHGAEPVTEIYHHPAT